MVKIEIRHITRQIMLVPLRVDAFDTFQWLGRLLGKSWLPSTSPPSLTSSSSSPAQPTWCAPTFSKWSNLQDSHVFPFASTSPAFSLWLWWSSPTPRELQVITNRRNINWTPFIIFVFIFVLFSLLFASTSSAMIVSDNSSGIVSTGALLLLQITVGSRLLPHFQDDVIWTMVTIMRHFNS